MSVLCDRVTTWFNIYAIFFFGGLITHLRKKNPTDLTYTGLPAEFKHISKQRKRY
jgi:hypothetical protein